MKHFWICETQNTSVDAHVDLENWVINHSNADLDKSYRLPIEVTFLDTIPLLFPYRQIQLQYTILLELVLD